MQKIAERIAGLRAEMKKAGMQAYIIPSADPHLSEYTPAHWQARKYFSGFTGSAGTLVVTERKSGLWTDGRYFIQAEHQLEGSGIDLYRMGVKGVPSYPEFLAEELGERDTVGFDGKLFSVNDVRAMEHAFEDKKLKLKTADLTERLWEDRPPVPKTQAFLHDVKYAGFTCAEKLDQVRKELKKHKADAQVFGRLDCVAWLMNIRANDVEDSPFAVAYAAVLPGAAYLFIDRSRVPADVMKSLTENGVSVRDYEDAGKIGSLLGKGGTILLDPEGTSYELYRLLKNTPGAVIAEGPDIVTELKSVKNATEIDNIKKIHVQDGCAMVKGYAALEEMLDKGEPVTECTVCDVLAKTRAQQPGNRGVSFATIAAYRDNAAMMHYSPKPDSCRKLEKSGFLLVDSGGQYDGGTTDITRTYALGPVSREERECYTWVLKAHIALATAVFLEGNTGGNIDILCREPLWKHGLDYRCGTGHGVGMFGGVHEGPQNLRRTDRNIFRKGMTITNEPGVYVDGKFGIRTENLMLVDDAFENEYGKFLKFDVVTRFPIDTAPILTEMLSEGEITWLNGYHDKVRKALAPLLSGRDLDWLEQHTRPLARGNQP